MRRALAFVAALALTGCGLFGDRGETYPVAAKDARATLLLTAPPLWLFGNDVAKATVSRDGDGTVRWVLVDKLGSGLLSIVARSEEVGEKQTRVTVSVEPPPGGRKEMVAKRLEENPAIADFFKAAMAEEIDAKFEKREFDMAAIQGEMIAVAFALAPQMQASVDEAARRSEQSDRTHIEEAYRREAQGNPYESYSDADEPAYGEPMDAAAGNY